MRSYKRTDRVASLIREAIAQLMVTDVRDPRVRESVVTHVMVTADLAIARIYVRSLVSDPQGEQELLKGLGRASGFLRAELGRRVHLARIPTLEFYYDETPDEAAHVDEIMAHLPEPAKDDPIDD